MITNFSWKQKIPSINPGDMEKVIARLKKTRNKEECLREAYAVMTKKYHGEKLKTYLKLLGLFQRDTRKIWAKKGFLHCTIMNYVMRILLVKSGKFREGDLKQKWTLLYYFSPHQYLQVKMSDDKIVDVDVWGCAYGIRLGDHAHGFHAGSIFS